LPQYMLPQHYITLDSLPLLPNGKVNRQALPAPQAHSAADDTSRTITEPTTPTEQTIAKIWAKLLGTTHISTTDNFFNLGGHSLLAMRAATDMQAATGQHTSLHQLIFETLEQIAKAASPAQTVALAPSPPPVSAPSGSLIDKLKGLFFGNSPPPPPLS
jgi:hypothetical protein